MRLSKERKERIANRLSPWAEVCGVVSSVMGKGRGDLGPRRDFLAHPRLAAMGGMGHHTRACMSVFEREWVRWVGRKRSTRRNEGNEDSEAAGATQSVFGLALAVLTKGSTASREEGENRKPTLSLGRDVRRERRIQHPWIPVSEGAREWKDQGEWTSDQGLRLSVCLEARMLYACVEVEGTCRLREGRKWTEKRSTRRNEGNEDSEAAGATQSVFGLALAVLTKGSTASHVRYET
ncbi:hypothetical protein K435DRAFT_843952 [Dendrothele bispora CBS 962.96]|uniref:Uncharacterized protein n=1 Tax=Dendrothele bispora (strain CBS 962.96) TaxID=1314807 RepID=A0A4S8L511_DENBC|nr:hypothetical protein K435DRAFT_843952 [Dendrothele bispora CBS 962.96]